MAEGSGRLAVVAIAGAALAAGIAAGWLGGRASLPPPPPPPTYWNPLRDAVKGETLVHYRAMDRATASYRVDQADAETVLLTVEYGAPNSPPSTRQIRVARASFGPCIVLEGDVDPEMIVTGMRQFALQSASPEDVRIEAIGRTFRCWKFVGETRTLGTVTYWVSDEVPVTGVVRVSSAKGVQWEIRGLGK